MGEKRLIWRCVFCAELIEDGTGYVDYDAYGLCGFDGWRAVHNLCDPSELDDSYWASVDRWRTAVQLQDSAAHMRSKPWWSETAWSALLLGLAASQ